MDLPEGFQRRGERRATVERASVDEEARSVELAFSSEAPVERMWGIEILGHAPGEMDEGWIGSGTAPLLMDHDARQQVGVVERVMLGEDRKARAVVRFSRSAKGEEAWRDVADGIRGNVSVGYELLEMREEPAAKGEPRIFRATRWRPLEVSLVSIPADMTVGVGRDAPPPTVPAQPKTKEAPPVDADTDTRADAAEAKRTKDIMDLARFAGMEELGRDAVIDGVSFDVFREKLREERAKAAKKPAATPAADLDMEKKEVRRYSVFRAMHAAATGDWSRAGLELEAHQEIAKKLGTRNAGNKHAFYVPQDHKGRMDPSYRGGAYAYGLVPMERSEGAGSVLVPLDIQRRDLSAVTGSAGGFLVETANMSFIDILRARSVLMRMGATRMSGLVGNVTVPRQTGAATAVWLANETTAITESDQAFSQMALSAKNVGAYTEVSRQLLLQSDPSAEQVVMNDLAAVVALAVDAAGIAGTGTGGQPTGIVNTAGIGAFPGATINYAAVLDAQVDVLTGNALINPASTGYVATPAAAAILAQRQRFASTDTPLWEGGLLDGQMVGFPAMSSTQMPTLRMLFGDFSQVVIGEWGTLELEMNPYANFPAGISGFRAIYTVDVGVRYAASFSYANANIT